MSQRATIVIPARYASTRLPGKPLLSLAGKPMIQWVYERATQIPNAGKVIVATDDKRIYDVVCGFGGNAQMTPETLATGSERVGVVARDLTSEIVVNLQGDEPLIPAAAVAKAIELVENDNNCHVATLGCPLTSTDEWENPSIVKVVTDINDVALYFSRAAIPHPRDKAFIPSRRLMRHIGVYVYRRKFLLDYLQWPAGDLESIELLEQLRILERGYRMRVARTDSMSPGVDTAEDVKVVEDMIKMKGLVE